MRTHLLGTTLLFLTANLAQADISKLWVGHHNGPDDDNDYGYLSALDSEGNLVVGGASTNALGVTEILTVKFDANGTKHWARTYPAPAGGPDYAFVIAVDPQDNVIVLGDSVGVGTSYDLVTLKYSPQGDLVWAQRYDGPASGYDGTSAGLSLDVDAGGNVYVGGYSAGVGTDYDSLVLKYSPAGALLWEARYDGPTSSRDYCYGLALDSAGNVCVTGETPDAFGGADFLVLKYDASGTLLWQEQYDGPAHGSDYVYMLAVGPSDEIVVTGSSPGVGTRDDIATVEYDANGILQWARRYDGPASGADIAFTVAIGDQGQVAVAGKSVNAYDSAAVTLLYDSNGNAQWARTHDLSPYYYGDDTGSDVAFDDAGNVLLVGSGWNGAESGYDVFLLRYEPTGTITFADAHDGVVHGDDMATRIVIRSGEVWLSGFSQRGTSRLDVLALHYGPQPPFSPQALTIEAGDPLPLPVHSRAQIAPSQRREGRPALPLRPRSRLPLGGTALR